MKIKLTDGRILIGIFLCTDKDANVILGTCAEYLSDESAERANTCSSINSMSGEPRMLGLAMVPGRHITSIYVDDDMSGLTPVPSNSPV
jgi:small nuclear ribonucleoprotein (snRNP)-like protein